MSKNPMPEKKAVVGKRVKFSSDVTIDSLAAHGFQGGLMQKLYDCKVHRYGTDRTSTGMWLWRGAVPGKGQVDVGVHYHMTDSQRVKEIDGYVDIVGFTPAETKELVGYFKGYFGSVLSHTVPDTESTPEDDDSLDDEVIGDTKTVPGMDLTEEKLMASTAYSITGPFRTNIFGK